MLEWNLTIPIDQFKEIPFNRYAEGVILADQAEKVLKGAVCAYWTTLKRQSKEISYSVATTHFWSKLDHRYFALLEAISNPQIFLNDTWYPIVRKAAQEAYAAACPHTTPRQIRLRIAKT
jgi:hypothetical protein